MNKDIQDIYQMTIAKIHGMTDAKAIELQEMGISSVGQLIDYFPFRYENYQVRKLDEVQDGERITIEAVVMSESVLQRYSGKSRLSCKMMSDATLLTAVWFNRHFLKKQLQVGLPMLLTGKWDRRRKQMTVAESEPIGLLSTKQGSVVPVYSVSGTLTQKWLRKMISQAISQFSLLIEEILPKILVDRHQLMSRRKALEWIHYPQDVEQGKLARKRMVYEEFFLFQLKIQAFRSLNRHRVDGVAHVIDLPKVRQFVRQLPFQLTVSQKNVIAEILSDMQQPFAMNRLLQGDVGSGKTIVAATVLLAAVTANAQGALLVPTEILAEQHWRSLNNLFSSYEIQIDLLTGSVSERQRKGILSALQMGLTQIIVGTHALIQEDVYFRKLGLVVTDEQHRFGVEQRSLLRRKGLNPDVLAMTATPIPRTLAITAFGDMDVSTLSELPKGRKSILTYWVFPQSMDHVYRIMAREVSQGRQVYVICPLIEESEKLDVQNAIDIHMTLSQYFPQYKIGLLHGRMTSIEKDATMLDFKKQRLHFLVSTTVIEVGVDVPNASLMVVYDADRFGLSQLHQLRGRVGRGPHQSYCVLISDPKTELGKERMKVMTETTDGFEIARRDLQLRGPGDFFGTKQSGVPDFRLADLMIDMELLEIARDDATELVADATFWTHAEYLALRHYLQREKIFDQQIFD
jgi:ATP-dependent DNA helicase RecG